MARGKRDCVYGRGPILTRESIRMAIGSSDLFSVALVGCQCLCMASKRRVALYLFLSGKILWRSIPSRSDASHTAGQGLNNRFLVMHFWFFFSKSNWRRRREKVQVGVLFVCRVFVYNSKSIRTYIPAVPTTRMYHIIHSLFVCHLVYYKNKSIKAGTHRVHPPVRSTYTLTNQECESASRILASN